VRAGELDRKITIEYPSTGQDTLGAEVDDWNILANVWAKVRDVAGREVQDNPGTAAMDTSSFLIRHLATVTRKMRIRYNGDIYNITSIKEIGRREGLEIQATAHQVA